MSEPTTAAATSTTLPLESSTLRRRHSIATSVVVPNKLSIPATPPRGSNFQVPPNQNQNQNPETTPSSFLNLNLVSFKSSFSSSYTSLKDVLPATNVAINSPTASSVGTAISPGYEIAIRNRLVKQAAWAYLQPMSASPSSSSAPEFLRRLWHKLSSGCRCNPVTVCFSFIYDQLVPGFARILHRILHAVRGHVRT